MKKILYYILSISPLPVLVGYLVRVRQPRFLIQLIIQKFFVEKLKVDITEAELPVEKYQTVLEFFTRRLKPGARSLNRDHKKVLSPVDGVVMNYGKINQGQMIQIKNISYSLEDLVGKDMSEDFREGDFITLYLSPRDYHRIHHPVGGQVDRVINYPGRLLPVNPFSLENFREVFSRNRRVVVSYNANKGKTPSRQKRQTPHLSCLSCWVGALNVGKMPIYFDENFYNDAGREVYLSRERFSKSYSSKKVDQGREAGCFELGSTVILIFPHHTIRWMPTISNNTFLKVGEAIAYIRPKTL